MRFFGKDLVSLPSEDSCQDDVVWLTPEEAQLRFDKDHDAAMQQMGRAIGQCFVVLGISGGLAIWFGWPWALLLGFIILCGVMGRQWLWWKNNGLNVETATDRCLHVWLAAQPHPEKQAYRLSFNDRYSPRVQLAAKRFLDALKASTGEAGA